jgi:hypothetical protein
VSHAVRVRAAEAVGFSLLELLIATMVLLVVTGGALRLISPAGNAFAAQPEAADLQQRLRVGVDSLRHELLMAGAGTYTGSPVGPLVYQFAPILPHAVGTLVPGSPDHPDAAVITVMYVPSTPAQTTTSTDLTSDGAELRVRAQPGCPVGDALCGFRQGMHVVIFDAFGRYDVFTIASVVADAMRLRHRDDRFTTAYPAGSFITELVSRTFYMDASERRLYSYDGFRSNLPILDNVVGLAFDYFGEPSPPVLRSAVVGIAAPTTTYGPSPPPPMVDTTGDDWGAGENCTFRMSDGVQVARLADWGGGSGPGALVPIPYTQVNDGPWCPGVTNAAGAALSMRFDADMLRVRRVRVTLRVQAGAEGLRGANPVGQLLFIHPGPARQGGRIVPDQEVRFEVTPRNMNVGR